MYTYIYNTYLYIHSKLGKVHKGSPFRFLCGASVAGQRTLPEEDEPFTKSLQPAVGRVQFNLPEVPWSLAPNGDGFIGDLS